MTAISGLIAAFSFMRYNGLRQCQLNKDEPVAKTIKEPDADLLIKNFILQGCKNAKQAAIDAHYSPKTAEQSASRVLRSVKAKEAIEKHKKASMGGFVWSKEVKLKKLEEIAKAAMAKDPEKGMINMPSAIAAMKEHNLMQGDNAPTVTENTHNVTDTLASKLTGGSKR